MGIHLYLWTSSTSSSVCFANDLPSLHPLSTPTICLKKNIYFKVWGNLHVIEKFAPQVQLDKGDLSALACGWEKAPVTELLRSSITWAQWRTKQMSLCSLICGIFPNPFCPTFFANMGDSFALGAVWTQKELVFYKLLDEDTVHLGKTKGFPYMMNRSQAAATSGCLGLTRSWPITEHL